VVIRSQQSDQAEDQTTDGLKQPQPIEADPKAKPVI